MSPETYRYEGPPVLGTLVAQRCSATGWTSAKRSSTRGEPDLVIVGREESGRYALELKRLRTDGGEPSPMHLSESNDEEGKAILGRRLLARLRDIRYIEKTDGWGDLVGVRPIKLYHRLSDRGYDAADIARHLRERYGTSEDKIALLRETAEIQRPILESLSDSERKVAVYGGIPFCDTRCSYCSFPFGLVRAYTGMRGFVESFKSDCADVRALATEYDLTPDCLYLGGGTPTALSESEFAELLPAFAALVESGRECTVEAGRPDSITRHKLDTMIRTGTTRISINPQTMNDAILRRIGRGHTVADILETFDEVRSFGRLDVNTDFIAGLPGQTMRDMMADMDFVERYMPENVTVHTLALKRGSVLYSERYRVDLPGETETEEMTTYASERLRAAGYRPYYLYRQQYMTGRLENIGYALPGKESRYNIAMMEECCTVLSVGAGGTSKWIRAPYINMEKQYMPKHPGVYQDTLSELVRVRCAKTAAFFADVKGCETVGSEQEKRNDS